MFRALGVAKSASKQSANPLIKFKNFLTVTLVLIILTLLGTNNNFVQSVRMVRLCIASVDPIRLSSQCVMCNRREFPLSAIDCTGISKMNDLISNPLTVQEATCLIYNCRRVSLVARLNDRS